VGNPVISTVEMIAAVFVAVLALLAPLIALALVAAFCWITVRMIRKMLRKQTPSPAGD
jgi:flagellar biogenesis protein FliO